MFNATRIITVIISFALLAGCVSYGDIHQTIQYRYIGQPIEYAVSYLGTPTRESFIDHGKLYVWDTGHSVVYSAPTAIPPGGYAGSSSNSSVTYATETQNFNCILTLVVNHRGIVTDYRVRGNLDGCERYAQ